MSKKFIIDLIDFGLQIAGVYDFDTFYIKGVASDPDGVPKTVLNHMAKEKKFFDHYYIVIGDKYSEIKVYNTIESLSYIIRKVTEQYQIGLTNALRESENNK